MASMTHLKTGKKEKHTYNFSFFISNCTYYLWYKTLINIIIVNLIYFK